MKKQLLVTFEEDFAAKWLELLSEEQKEEIRLAIKQTMIAYITMRRREAEDGDRKD